MEGQVCGGSNDCACGLDCTASQCLVSCDPMGVAGECGANRACVPLTAGGGVCLDVGGRDEDCTNTFECLDPFQCDPSASDTTGITEATCHQPCGQGQTCANGESCLPSTPGYYTVQTNDGGNVPCTVGGQNPQCDTVNGFDCVALGSGELCSKQIVACGTPVAPADLTPLFMPDAGGDFPAGDICNLGTTLTRGMETIAGSRFCDSYSSLANPPAVFCQSVYDSAPSAGVCLALCTHPNADCPSGYHCDTTPGRNYFVAFTDTDTNTMGLQTRVCATDMDCTDLGMTVTCGGPYASQNNMMVCVEPVGQCQPD